MKKCHYCGKNVDTNIKEQKDKGMCKKCLNVSEKFDSFDAFHAYITDVCGYWEKVVKEEIYSNFI